MDPKELKRLYKKVKKWDEKFELQQKELEQKRSRKALKSLLKSKYGITLEAYDALLQSQNGLCRICRQAPQKRRLAIDHDHVTGQVRGLLCTSCNLGIGSLKDDPQIILSAYNYLIYFKGQKPMA